MGGESSINHSENIPSSFNRLPDSSRLNPDENYPPAGNLINASPDGRMTMARNEGEWGVDRGSEVAEAGTSYASSDVAEDGGGISVLTPSDEIGGNFQNIPGPIIPKSFEEQMMLVMAVSLAEARSMPSEPEVSWQ